MRFKTTWIYPVLVLMPGISCTKTKTEASGSKVTAALKPVVVTDSVAHDSDDPAIWINKHNPSKSLVLGTDKMEITGSLYVFDLEGHIKPDLVIDSLDRPNNVAVAYNVPAGNDTLDIAVVTERRNGQIRLFSLPDMQAVDDGGIPVFTNQPAYNLVMGIGVYQPASKEKNYLIVSRKEAPGSTRYLHQYELLYNSQTQQFEVKLVRQFGRFEGSTEIEAIAVDNELGYIYYSDEGYGIRKYDADPASGNTELAVFGRDNFIEDREGIAIYSTSDSTGYLIVSDQQAGQIHLYPREGTPENPDHHPLIKEIPYQALETDGIEVTSVALNNKFPEGMLVAMSETKNFELYSWKQIPGLINP